MSYYDDVRTREASRVFDLMLDRKGFTVKWDGGSFGQYLIHYANRKGYGVSLPEFETRVSADVLNTELFEAILKRYEGMRRSIEAGANGGFWIGGWYDIENEYVYFDITEIVETQNEAEEYSREWGQIAYIDFENNRIIKL